MTPACLPAFGACFLFLRGAVQGNEPTVHLIAEFPNGSAAPEGKDHTAPTTLSVLAPLPIEALAGRKLSHNVCASGPNGLGSATQKDPRVRDELKMSSATEHSNGLARARILGVGGRDLPEVTRVHEQHGLFVTAQNDAYLRTSQRMQHDEPRQTKEGKREWCPES